MQREVHFIKRLIKRRPISDNLVHLHWLHHQGPAALRGVTSAVAICGKRELPHGKITVHLVDTTCPKCLRLSTPSTT